MAEHAMWSSSATEPSGEDVNAVTTAVLTASRLLVAVSARSLAAVEERVTLPQFRMLVVLASRPGMKLVTLAEQLAVNPSTAMRMVERLVAAGLVDRRVNPESRREILLCLTDAGAQIVDEVTSRRREEIAAIVAAMAPGQRAGLITALQAFTEAGGEPAPGEPVRDILTLGWQ
ncbi:MarR family winged helix-turn-helix transcriptional regulator [Actinoallomurus acaciae]|uniref:MarR family winged helix-turn-helix transcriptional regulator n=1 Tax=Actinoallomurus acaciae TaxID=502577 RepID=A0ABV5YE88_9ACTN